jgi:tRNA pseudouridine38-40 synthase
MGSVNVRLDIAYDGTDFAGWQIQENGRTVQEVIQEALKKIHNEEIIITAAGRTDSGVHAREQVVNFKIDNKTLSAEKYKDAINYYLPEDVRILKSRIVEDDFNARFSARIRVYRYYIYCSQKPYPHYRKYCYWIRYKPDIIRLNRISAVLLGEHDFSTFAASGDSSNSKIKNVLSSCFYIEGPFIVFKIAAGSYLYKMVRSIVGTILQLEKNNLGEKEMIKILKFRNRQNAGKTAPPRGLFLDKVVYEGEKQIIY